MRQISDFNDQGVVLEEATNTGIHHAQEHFASGLLTVDLENLAEAAAHSMLDAEETDDFPAFMALYIHHFTVAYLSRLEALMPPLRIQTDETFSEQAL